MLIIDEAQDLTDELLEQVRLLSNLETDEPQAAANRPDGPAGTARPPEQSPPAPTAPADHRALSPAAAEPVRGEPIHPAPARSIGGEGRAVFHAAGLVARLPLQPAASPGWSMRFATRRCSPDSCSSATASIITWSASPFANWRATLSYEPHQRRVETGQADTPKPSARARARPAVPDRLNQRNTAAPGREGGCGRSRRWPPSRSWRSSSGWLGRGMTRRGKRRVRFLVKHRPRRQKCRPRCFRKETHPFRIPKPPLQLRQAQLHARRWPRQNHAPRQPAGSCSSVRAASTRSRDETRCGDNFPTRGPATAVYCSGSRVPSMPPTHHRSRLRGRRHWFCQNYREFSTGPIGLRRSSMARRLSSVTALENFACSPSARMMSPSAGAGQTNVLKAWNLALEFDLLARGRSFPPSSRDVFLAQTI